MIILNDEFQNKMTLIATKFLDGNELIVREWSKKNPWKK